MKMIIAIVGDDDSDRVTKTLTGAEFRVTTIGSTGGFLRKGQSTMLIGVEDATLEKALSVLRSCFPPDPNAKETRCTIFVLNVNQSHHF
jgi:uncharacterized protein YaaQ